MMNHQNTTNAIQATIKKHRRFSRNSGVFGTPGAIRTHGLWSRSPTLYPAELRAHISVIFYYPITVK